MKKVSLWLVSILLTLLLAGMLAYVLFPRPKIGGDFDLRYNEISCVLDGVDPYDIWIGKVEHAPYYPYINSGHRSETLTRRVNAYPPWGYAFAYSFTLLPEAVAWILYATFNALALVGLILIGFRYAQKRLPHRLDAQLVGVLSVLLIVPALVSVFQSGNYPIIVLIATLGLIACLEKGHDILAGFCWALAMLKPQMALLYAIPLLFRRKILTCAVAAGTCLVASVPAMLLCHKGLIELIRNGILGPACGFIGCGTCPAFLLPLLGSSCCIYLGLIVGALICAYLTWKTDPKEGWLIYLTPALFLSTCWSYAQLYASVVNWIVFMLLLIALFRQSRSKAFWMILILSLLFLTRIYTLYHGFTMLFPDRFGYSWALHGQLDSLNSLAALLVFIGFWGSVGKGKRLSL